MKYSVLSQFRQSGITSWMEQWFLPVESGKIKLMIIYLFFNIQNRKVMEIDQEKHKNESLWISCWSIRCIREKRYIEYPLVDHVCLSSRSTRIDSKLSVVFSGHAVNAFWWSTLNYLCLFYSYNQTYNLNGIEIPCRLNHIPLIVDLSSSRIGFPPHVSSPPRRVARSLVSRWRHTLLSNRWLVFPTRVFLRQVLRSDCV